MKRTGMFLVAGGAGTALALVLGSSPALAIPPGPSDSLSVGNGLPITAGTRATLALSWSAGASTVTASKYQLVFGDGTRSLSGSGAPPATVTHAYNRTGVFTTKLLVQDSSGTTLTALAGVLVTAKPAAGAPTFGTASPVAGLATAFAVGDLNGDGKADVAGTTASGDLAIELSNGDGTFRPGPALPALAGPVTDARIADLNGDGKPDLVVDELSPDSHTFTLQALLGDGTGAFTAVAAAPIAETGLPTGGWFETDAWSSPAPLGISVADVDGDGHADVIVPWVYLTDTAIESGVTVLKGAADGTWTTLKATAFPSPSATGYGAFEEDQVFADANGDGIPDIVSINQGAIHTWLIHPDGSATLGGTFAIPTGLQGFVAAAADLDGDGHVDLLAEALAGRAAQSGSVGATDYDTTFAVLHGNGTGGFTLAGSLTVPDWKAQQGIPPALVTDLNRDGRPDLAMRGFAMAFGDGHGGVALDPVTGWASDATATLAGDVNGDGKPDLVETALDANALPIVQVQLQK